MYPFELTEIVNLTYATVSGLIATQGYLAVFFFMILEAASFPVPSEIVLPAIGYFAARGEMNLLLGFASALIVGTVGMAIDYYIAYFLGKDIIYKHLGFFHIKKESLLAFDAWFAENGDFAVFVSRLLPVVRSLINFPAGFAEMPFSKFLLYSVIGTAMWDVLLIGFGYYALSVDNAYAVAGAIVAFSVVLYVVYVVAMKRIRRKMKKAANRR
jgi:membrane protein DedA with SNARE-associated domain